MQCCKNSTTGAETAVSAYVAEAVRPLLSERRLGEVLMVNSKGIYLSVDDRILFMCDASWGLVPLGIAIRDFSAVSASLGLSAGDRFVIGENALCFPKKTLKICLEVRPRRAVSLSESPLPSRIREAATEILRLKKTGGISLLASPLVLGEPPEGVLCINPYCERAYGQLLLLLRALREDADGVRSAVSALLGLGTGLTPSADDVLLGMLYAFRLLPNASPPYLFALRDAVLDGCGRGTNAVSAAYLRAILDGAYFERIEEVWGGLCGQIPLDVARLTEIGSNSGSEMLLGMLLALLVCGYGNGEESRLLQNDTIKERDDVL